MPYDVAEVAARKCHRGGVAADDPAVGIEQGDRVSHGIEGLAPLGGGGFETCRHLVPVGDVLEVADDGNGFARLVALGRALAVEDVLAAVSMDDAELDRWRLAGLETCGASPHERVDVVGMYAHRQRGYDVAVELVRIDVEQFEQLL